MDADVLHQLPESADDLRTITDQQLSRHELIGVTDRHGAADNDGGVEFG